MAESIELQIKSDAQQATRAIGNLQAKLQGLGDTLNSLNGASISNFASGMSQLATSLRSVSSIDTRTFSKIATNMEKLGNLDTARLVSSASALKSMATELSGFANISKQSAEITQLTASISKLGSKSAGYAADNIRNLGSALKEVMTTLSSAPRVSNNIIQMTNALANLSQQGSKVGSASRSLVTGFSNTTKSIKSTRSGFRGLASTIGKFYATYWMVMRAVGKIGSAVDLASQLTEVQNVVDTTFGDMASKVDDFTKTSIQDFGMSELTVKQISSRFQALGTSIGISSEQVANGTAVTNKALMSQNNTLYKTTDSMADMSLNLTRLAGDMASFYDVDQADVAKSLQSIFSGTIAPLRRYGLDLTQATLSEWAMKNGLDANIKSMTQAEKVLLRYNYVMANTQAAQGDFAKTANTWANSVRVLKQEFQAWGSIIGSVIINALKPFVQALSKVMLKVISFTRTVADALGAIFGWTIEISGGGATVDGMEDIADGVGDIGDNADSSNKKAQKLKKTLLSIDEIHALDDNSDSGSGGGSGSGGSGGGGAGGGVDSSLKKTDGLLEKYKSSIKDLYSLGKYIGDALASAMESIDWKKIYQKADNFGKGLADFLNGLISPRLFYDLGATIAGSLNTALHFLDSFGTTFDWTNFGLSIANGINGFFENFDFALLGQTISAWAKGILSTLTAAVENTNWAEIGTQIGTFFANIDWVGVFQDVHKLVNGLAEGIITGLANWFKEDPLSATIVAGFALAKLTGIDKKVGALLSSKLSNVSAKVGLVLAADGVSLFFDSKGTDANSIVSPLMTGLGAKLLGASWQISVSVAIVLAAANIGLAVGNWIAGTDVTWGDIFKNLSDTSWWTDLLTYISGDLAKFGGNLVTDVNNWLVDFINGIITKLNKLPFVELPLISESAKVTKDDVKKYGEEVDQAVQDMQNGVGQSVGKTNEHISGAGRKLDEYRKKTKDDTSDISSSHKTASDSVKNSLSGTNSAIDGTKNKMGELESKSSTSTTNSKGVFNGLANALGQAFSNINSGIDGTKGKMGEMENKSSTSSTNSQSAFSRLKNGLLGFLASINNSINGNKAKMGEMQDKANSSTNGAKSSFSDFAAKASRSLANTNNSMSGTERKMNNLPSVWRGISLPSITAKIKIPHLSVSWEDFGKFSLPKISIRYYRQGGFPKGEDGMFLANHNEMIGKFSNGKNVVANNQQITEGIKQAVMEGMAQVMMNYNAGGNSAPIIENVFKCDSETLYRMTQVGKEKHGQRYIVANEFG